MKAVNLSWKSLYITVIAFVGLALVALGFNATAGTQQPGILIALVLLGFLAEFGTTFFNRSGFTISTAFWLATAAVFSPFAAALVVGGSAIGYLYNDLRQADFGWRVRGERLGFNLGMFGLSAVAGGGAYVALTSRGGGLAVEALAWLVAALVAYHTNVLVLTGMRWIQNRESFLDVYKLNLWVMPIDILVGSLGAGIFAAAVQQMSYAGILIFVLPIILSTYAARLYARQTEAQMARLEAIVAERTQELSETNAEMVTLARQKDHFLAILSHDMRTPLTAIRLYGQMLRDNPDLPRDKRRHMSQVVLTNELSLTDMVENILAIEEMRSGVPLHLARAEFDLSEMTLRACATIEGQAAAKQIELNHEMAPGVVRINGDIRYLQRVVVNLLSNAVKYTPEGGTVTINVTEQGQEALITVRDTGYGIPAEDLAAIFEPYRRVEAHKNKARGSGLGLSIVRYLVEAHGGTISVESGVDVGSVFTVRLPLADYQAATDPRAAQRAEALPSGAAASVPQPDSLPSLPHRPLSA